MYCIMSNLNAKAMKKHIFILLIALFFLSGCAREEEAVDSHVLRIVGYKCNSCIVAFTQDVARLDSQFGESPNDYYHAINLKAGDFSVGQQLKAKVRKAKPEEDSNCQLSSSSIQYQGIYVLSYKEHLPEIKDTIELSLKDCVDVSNQEFSVCFDSVLSDSRCPIDAVCVWAGEANARFKIVPKNGDSFFTDLKIGQEATVLGFTVTFIDLTPFPELNRITKPEEYKARINMVKN